MKNTSPTDLRPNEPEPYGIMPKMRNLWKSQSLSTPLQILGIALIFIASARRWSIMSITVSTALIILFSIISQQWSLYIFRVALFFLCVMIISDTVGNTTQSQYYGGYGFICICLGALSALVESTVRYSLQK